jgi:hypothetical protein
LFQGFTPPVFVEHLGDAVHDAILFQNTPGNDYIITVGNGVNQELTGVTNTNTGYVTLASAGNDTYTLISRLSDLFVYYV